MEAQRQKERFEAEAQSRAAAMAAVAEQRHHDEPVAEIRDDRAIHKEEEKLNAKAPAEVN